MNESIKNMIERRSVRGYKPDMIPKEDLEKLFQKFYRVEQSRSQNTGGTGLGLSISKNIITLHRGTINVYSEPGKGTTFTVRVPMNREKDGE